MHMILKRNLEALDGTDPKNLIDAIIPAGTHEIERVPHPAGLNCSWLVLKGTKIGASEISLRDWTRAVAGKANLGESEIIIRE